MKKKSPPISMFVMIAVIGLLISFLNGDFAIASIFEDLEGISLKFLLDELNLILGFVVLALVFIFWIWHSTRDEKEFYWEFDKEQEQEDDETGMKRPE